MTNIILFFSLLLVLFFLSRVLVQELSQVFSKLFRSYEVTVRLLALLFLPGVIIHELSHWLVASVLFVHTGDIEFVPQIHKDGVKLGSVAIASTDPLRRFLIGIAPFLGGLGIMLLAGRYLFPIPTLLSWQTVIFVYILFEIGNTMFSSRKDLEGAIGFFILMAILIGVFFFLGGQIPHSALQFALSQSTIAFFKTLDMFLFFAVGINGGLTMVLKIFIK